MEVERARLTHQLALINEKNGDINGAATIMQELQVETYGSMEKQEKVTKHPLFFHYRRRLIYFLTVFLIIFSTGGTDSGTNATYFSEERLHSHPNHF